MNLTSVDLGLMKAITEYPEGKACGTDIWKSHEQGYQPTYKIKKMMGYGLLETTTPPSREKELVKSNRPRIFYKVTKKGKRLLKVFENDLSQN